MKGRQTVARQELARFCSVVCRSASGRLEVVCENCALTFTMKANKAADRHFCSRKCMFAKWGCSICSKIRPEDRRMAQNPYCSDRCSLTAHLEDLASQTGELLAACHICRNILPAGSFTKERKNRNGLSNRCKACTKTYYNANKDQYQRRRYIYQAALGGIIVDFTPRQKAARFALWGGRCWICGIAGATEEDHVKPISKGGSHCLANLRPICKKCNTSKSNRWPLPVDLQRANFSHPEPRSGRAADEVTERQPRVEWTCPECGKSELIRAHLARTRKYCSRTCLGNSRAAKTVKKVCMNPLCSAVFVLPGGRGSEHRKFCSLDCAWIARNRPAHWRSAGEGQLTLF